MTLVRRHFLPAIRRLLLAVAAVGALLGQAADRIDTAAAAAVCSRTASDLPALDDAGHGRQPAADPKRSRRGAASDSLRPPTDSGGLAAKVTRPRVGAPAAAVRVPASDGAQAPRRPDRVVFCVWIV